MVVGSWLNTYFQTGLETGLMYLPDDNEGKGAAVVCWAHHVSRHSLNTSTATPWRLLWPGRLRQGKQNLAHGLCARSFTASLTHGCMEGTGQSGSDGQKKCLRNMAAKIPLVLYHWTKYETCPYLQTNMNPTGLSNHGLWTQILFYESCPMGAHNVALSGNQGLPMWSRWQHRNLSQLKTSCGMWERHRSQLRLPSKSNLWV